MNVSDASEVNLQPALLDRLVDGELNEPDRTSLLRSLDRRPEGWKQCALAFLEAQAWRVAAADVGTRAELSCAAAERQAWRLPAIRQLLAVAAVVAVAFCGGFVSRGAVFSGTGPRTTTDIAQRPSQPDGIVATAATQVAKRDVTPAPAVPEFLRAQMERQGYRVEGDRRVVPVALGDGRKVAVPMDTVSLRYVGQRVY